MSGLLPHDIIRQGTMDEKVDWIEYKRQFTFILNCDTCLYYEDKILIKLQILVFYSFEIFRINCQIFNALDCAFISIEKTAMII